MGKGGYRGGSTIIRTRPKLSGRKNPKKGALESWVAGAKEAVVTMPDDIRLKPISDARPEGKASKKKKAKEAKKPGKKQRAKAAKADRKLHDSKGLFRDLCGWFGFRLLDDRPRCCAVG